LDDGSVSSEVVDPLPCEFGFGEDGRVPPVSNGMAHEFVLRPDLFLDDARVMVRRMAWREEGGRELGCCMLGMRLGMACILHLCLPAAFQYLTRLDLTASSNQRNSSRTAMWVLEWNGSEAKADVDIEDHAEEMMWAAILEEVREEEEEGQGGEEGEGTDTPRLVWFETESSPGCRAFVVSAEPFAWFLFEDISTSRLSLRVFGSESELLSNQPIPGPMMSAAERRAFWSGLRPGDRFKGKLVESVLLAKGTKEPKE